MVFYKIADLPYQDFIMNGIQIHTCRTLCDVLDWVLIVLIIL